MTDDASPPPVRVELLGPLRLFVGGVPVEVVGPKRRAALALLAFAEDRVVPTERLVEALWPVDGADPGRAALHNHVSRLRRHLGSAASRLRTTPSGYQLELGRDGLDVAQARTLLAEARHVPDHTRAYELLRQAYGLWRGPVLADLEEHLPIAAAIQACDGLRREIADALVEKAIAAGVVTSIVDTAARSYLDDPLREPAALLYMRALAHAGRTPDALRIAAEFRQRLAEETGLDPSAALDELIRDIARGALRPASDPWKAPTAAPVAVPAPAAGAVALPTSPGSADRLIGRESTVAALHRLLAAERLVTLVGPGGVGKTRVAREVLRRSESATVLLLASVADPAAIPHALAAALGLTGVQGDPLAASFAVLAERPATLLIDNCEHVLDAVRRLVDTLLVDCPQLTVLATSREPLGLPAEYVSRLAPLSLPGTVDVARAPSVALFLQRAARARPDAAVTPEQLPAVAEVVRRLDGMPLAIELAAGRLSTFTVDELRERLDRALDLFGRRRAPASPDSDQRHATLRATIEWSYALLTEDEQRLFRTLSVFVDGFDLDTVEHISADLGLAGDPVNALARLVDASMIVADVSGRRTRYRMLHLLRAFGEDRLGAAGEVDAAVERLLRWAVEIVASLEADLLTDREPDADARLRLELANLRYAWQRARATGALETAAAMISALHDAVTYRDLLEVRDWAEELADDPFLHTSPRAGTVLGTAGEAAYHRGDYARAAGLARRGLELAADDAARWRCLATLCVVDLALEDYDACVTHALAAAELGPRVREEYGIAALAFAYRGRLAEARELNARGLAGARWPTMRSWAAYVSGEIDNFAGAPERAEEHYLRAIELARDCGATFLVGIASLGLLTVRAAAGRVEEALAGFREVIEYFARNNDWTHQWVVLRNLAQLLERGGEPDQAAKLDAAINAGDRATALDLARRALS